MDGGDDVMVILCCKCKVIFLSVGIFGAKRPQQASFCSSVLTYLAICMNTKVEYIHV